MQGYYSFCIFVFMSAGVLRIVRVLRFPWNVNSLGLTIVCNGGPKSIFRRLEMVLATTIGSVAPARATTHAMVLFIRNRFLSCFSILRRRSKPSFAVMYWFFSAWISSRMSEWSPIFFIIIDNGVWAGRKIVFFRICKGGGSTEFVVFADQGARGLRLRHYCYGLFLLGYLFFIARSRKSIWVVQSSGPSCEEGDWMLGCRFDYYVSFFSLLSGEDFDFFRYGLRRFVYETFQVSWYKILQRWYHSV